MAYETFIPTVWNESLQRELEPKLVLANTQTENTKDKLNRKVIV